MNPTHTVLASHAKFNESFEPDKSDSEYEKDLEYKLQENQHEMTALNDNGRSNDV